MRKNKGGANPLKSRYFDDDLNGESVEVQNDEARSIVQTFMALAGYKSNNNHHFYDQWTDFEGELSF